MPDSEPVEIIDGFADSRLRLTRQPQHKIGVDIVKPGGFQRFYGFLKQ